MIKRKAIWAWLICVLGIVIFYVLVGRPLVVEAYQDAAPVWFNFIINVLYPRFWVEKYRFELGFFLQKADQVLFRFALVNGMAIAFTIFFSYSPSFKRRVSRFWSSSVPVKRVTWLRILLYAGILFFTYDWYWYLVDFGKAAVFYKPILLLKLLGVPFPSAEVSLILCILLVLSCMAVIFSFQMVLSSVIVAALFVLIQGWINSFEKIDHTFATLTYAIILMPFLLYQQQMANRHHSSVQAGWPLQLIKLSISLVYFMAGLEKLLISGWHWLDKETFRSYIFLHQVPLGLWIAKSDFLSVLLPLFALVFQLSFISILFFPRLTAIFLLAGIAFHMGTYLLLQVGWYFNAWVLVYIFFINWESLEKRIRSLTAKGIL